MTMTCHVLHAGDGYSYLTQQVASGDVVRVSGEPLEGYYTAEGNPPGQWAGSGIADLGMSGLVSEEHMLALFGEGRHPDAAAMIAKQVAAGRPYAKALRTTQLGRAFYRYTGPDVPLATAVAKAYKDFAETAQRRPTVEERREIKERVATAMLTPKGGPPPAPEAVRKFIVDQLGQQRLPVAGFDLVFSPVKSVSVVWALLGDDVRQVVEDVHEQAWKTALAYGEREAGYTRTGRNGVAQIDTNGFVATAFVHRDSRCGDPDLHTHVVVANRVLGADGQWRTLDSQQVHRIAVSMSEVYNAALEQGLTDRLGVAWTEVSHGADLRPVREIAGVPEVLTGGFSQRRSQVETGYERLVADYVRTYGQTPPRSVQMQLAQRATLEDRPEKKLRSLDQQRADWAQRAQELVPDTSIRAIRAELAGCLNRTVAAAEPVDVAALAEQVIGVVSDHRATWTVYHVRAEAIRQLKPYAFDSQQAREAATEQVVATALDTESVALSVPTGQATEQVPVLLQRRDGESIYARHGATRYTSEAILAAEDRLLAAARTEAGPVVDERAIRAAIATYEQSSGRTLNPGQRQLVRQFVGSGRLVSVGIGPPGTGKSTTMRAVRAAWETTGGRVLGLAPSAAAASVLGAELGVTGETLHKLARDYREGKPVDVRAGDMLLVDEAGMAGTLLLDTVREIAAERGAVWRGLGDYRQLGSVEAGGALRLLHHDIGGTELSEVHRFRDPAEAAAVLQVRVGDQSAIPFYVDHGWLHGGARAAVLDQLYADWRGDVDAGRASIMISDSNDVARELAGRAQTERRAAGLAEAGGVALHDGMFAGVGDRVVTRQNSRRLAVLAGQDYVKNGDLWDVLTRQDDGTLTVRHLGHGGRITLPAWYVAEHTELGYAATVHRSQGTTVDVSRLYLSPLAARETALVGLSRGTHENHAYLDTDTILDSDEPETLPGDLFYGHRVTEPAVEAFAAILRREGAEISATEQLREAQDTPYRLDVVVPQYVHAWSVYRGPGAAEQAAGWVWEALPERAEDILADPAWTALATVLHEAHAAGADPVPLLAERAAARPLEDDPHSPARSVAEVLHYRITADPAGHRVVAVGDNPGADPDRPMLLPGWIISPPPPETTEPSETDPVITTEVAEVGEWLRRRADEIADRVYYLGEQAAQDQPAWTAHLGPVPDDLIERDTWIARAGQVAAYREHWQISPADPELLPDAGPGEAAHARAWVQHYLNTEPHCDTPPVVHTEHIELDQTTPQAAEQVPTWTAEPADQERDLRRHQERLDAIAARTEDLHLKILQTAALLGEPSEEVRAEIQARAADAAAHWQAQNRPYGPLSDQQLAAETEQAQARRDQYAAQLPELHARAQQLAAAATAGPGPHEQAVHEHQAVLAQRAALGHQIRTVQRELDTTMDEARRAGRAAWSAGNTAEAAPWYRPDVRRGERERAEQARGEQVRIDARAEQLRAQRDALLAQLGRDEQGRDRDPDWAIRQYDNAQRTLSRDVDQARAADQRGLAEAQQAAARMAGRLDNGQNQLDGLQAEQGQRACTCTSRGISTRSRPRRSRSRLTWWSALCRWRVRSGRCWMAGSGARLPLSSF